MDNPYPVTSNSFFRRDNIPISLFSFNEVLFHDLKKWFGQSAYRFYPLSSEEQLLEKELLGELLILDLRLSSLEGFPLIRRLKDWHPELPILVCLSQPQQGLGHTAVTLGADDFILDTELANLLPRFLRRGLEKKALDQDLTQTKRLLSLELARRGNYEEPFNAVLREVENRRLYNLVNLQKQYLESVFSHVQSGVIAVNRKEEVKTFNPKAEEILGITSNEALSRNFRFLPVPFVELLEQTLQEGKSFYRYQIRLPQNGRPIGVNTSQLKGENGEVIGCVVVFADLTEVEKQHSLRRRQEHMNFVTQVAMRSSHELKNCLVSIRTFTQLLPEKYSDPQFRTDFYSIVNSEVDRLTLLVDNLNFFAQPLDLYCVPTSLDEIFEEALALIPKEEKKRWQFLKEISLNGVDFVCDPENMKKVFVHCFRNAIQATPNGGTLWVRAFLESHRAKEKVDFICIQIHDTGNGMTQEEREQVFEPFFTTKNQGIGLGLTIVKKIIEAHGGKVILESNVGKGTTVSMWVPIKNEQDFLQTNESATTHLNS